MMEMKVLLVDSDQRLCAELVVMLHMFQCFRVVENVQTAEEAIAYVQSNEVDVVFANHQPADPRVTSGGAHLAAVLGQSCPHIQVVIYSNTAEWAYNAYRCQCAGYLLVPFDPLALQSLVNRLRYVFDLQQAKREVSNRGKMGVDIELNMVIGKVLTITELFEQGYEAVFIGSGAGLPMFMKIPGESLVGVYSANEYLTRINLMKAYKDDAPTPVLHNKKVAVVGGGNVAMDAARCAKRLGAEVYIVYRRSEAELPARAEEVEHAKEEGIIFKTLTNPTEILGYHNPDDPRDPRNGSVAGIRCVEMELGEPDASGRRRPIVKQGSEFDIELDCVIMALGTSPNPLIKSTTEGLETEKWGGIIADENGLTSRENVYAGGDAVTGAATVILAMGAGKTAAKAIDETLSKK